MRNESRSTEPGTQWAQVDADLEIVHAWAETVAVMAPAEDGIERRRAALDECSRHVLRSLDADIERLQAVTVAGQALSRQLLKTEGPGRTSDVYDLAAALAHRAEQILRSVGMPLDAWDRARRAVIAEADPERPHRWIRRRWMKWRRQAALMLDVARR